MPAIRPKLFVIGAGGFVGSWVARRAADKYEVVVGVRRPAPDDRRAVVLDITEPESVRAAFATVRPEVVLLTAAMADIDQCEREQSLAERVNYLGPLHVAQECQRYESRLLFTSTDAVFDGTLASYAEDAAPTPVNFYGQTKAGAEAAIRQQLPAATIVRFSLVLGRSPQPGTNSYLDKLAATLEARQTVKTPTFEYRNPIDVSRLADTLIDLSARPAPGIFHIGSSDKMSRYELARRLAGALGASTELVQPQTEPTPGRAPRGLDDFLVCERLPGLIGFRVPTCEEVIERAVHGIA